MPDLSEAFGRPATALGGLLPPRAKTQAAPEPRTTEEDKPPRKAEPSPPRKAEIKKPVEPPTPEPEEIEELDEVEERPAPRTATRSTQRPRREQQSAYMNQPQVDTQTHQTMVYISPAAKQAAEQRRRRDNLTNAELALNAVDAVYDDLPELLAAHRAGPGRPDDSLFPPRRAIRRIGTGRLVPWAFQATAVELKILDGLVQDLRASSRSEIVAVALQKYLLPRQGRRI